MADREVRRPDHRLEGADLPDAHEGITIDFELTEQPDGRWLVSHATYVPTQWNHYTPGNPIRIVAATGTHLASVRGAVNGVGGNRGLVEKRLTPRPRAPV